MPDRKQEFAELYRKAVAAAQEGNEAEAQLGFARAATYAPELWCDMATKLAKEGAEDMALEHWRMALQVTDHAQIRSGIFNNIAILYAKRGQLKEAFELLEQALKCDSQSADAYTNLGQVHKWNGNLELADRYCARALAINPWHNEAQFLQALNALDRGDYLNGFRLYECRWRSKTNGFRRVECDKPEWHGEPGNKRLFVYCEQGAGDIFLMLRYAPMIRALGLWQHWALKPGMGELVAGLVDSWSEDGTPPEAIDCHVPSASLPFIFGTTIETIPPCGYLQAPTGGDMSLGEGFHVGICWRGNTGQYNDGIRSTSLEQWKEVLNVPGVTFHSMQVDGALEAIDYPVINNYPPPANWLQTAKRLASLDLLISVDTGIVHLAGAMGLPVWCALHCRPYFVFPVVRKDTPWYPTVRLFKQAKAFQWKPVFELIASELLRIVLADAEITSSNQTAELMSPLQCKTKF